MFTKKMNENIPGSQIHWDNETANSFLVFILFKIFTQLKKKKNNFMFIFYQNAGNVETF